MSKLEPTITIQPGQPGEGMNYNVHKPLPYPFHVNTETGDVMSGPHTGNETWRLVGFQPDADTQTVTLRREDFAAEPNKAVGLCPVFVDEHGCMFNLTEPITRATDNR